MGQQPNIELRISDLPRPTRHPAAPRRWAPQRAGEVTTPSDMPWGGLFGTPGPDGGYALRLVADRPLVLAQGEDRHDAEAAVAVLMAARASRFGRGPTPTDAEVAELLLGLAGEASEEMVALRRRLRGLGHRPEAARRLAASVTPETLSQSPEVIRSRMQAGERLLAL